MEGIMEGGISQFHRTIGTDVFHLSNGFYMINHVSDDCARVMWYNITNEQREEFIAIYGDENKARQGLEDEIKSADHAASFYNGPVLVGIMWAGWNEVNGIGRVRTLGCVTTHRMREHGYAFAKHSDEMRDCFEMTEPYGATELYVAIQKSYRTSREWCIRMCKFDEIGETVVNGEPFVLYVHRYGGLQ